jgi:hypothetical protein
MLPMSIVFKFNICGKAVEIYSVTKKKLNGK